MKSAKPLILLLNVLWIAACTQKSDNQIEGRWKYERMVLGDLKTSSDTLAHVLSEMMYDGSVLEFYANDSFRLTHKDTTSRLQGVGTYHYDPADQTLLMQNVATADSENRMKVAVKELTADSLKLGDVEELIIYSRIKE